MYALYIKMEHCLVFLETEMEEMEYYYQKMNVLEKGPLPHLQRFLFNRLMWVNQQITPLQVTVHPVFVFVWQKPENRAYNHVFDD